MDDANRNLLDDEISRVHGKLKVLNPDTEEYEKVMNKLVRLTELANKDDEERNKFTIDKDRIEAEASLEASKRGIESEKIDAELRIKEAEAQIRESEAKRSWFQFGISAGITVFTFVGTWVMNRISQNRSEYFEATGQAYTSRFGKWQLKEPIHPNPLLRNNK